MNISGFYAVSPIILVIIPLAVNPEFMVTFETQEMTLSAVNTTIEPELR